MYAVKCIAEFLGADVPVVCIVEFLGVGGVEDMGHGRCAECISTKRCPVYNVQYEEVCI